MLFRSTATTEIYTLSLHDALPISAVTGIRVALTAGVILTIGSGADSGAPTFARSVLDAAGEHAANATTTAADSIAALSRRRACLLIGHPTR